MSFLDKLADQINNQFSLGENTTKSLDTVVDGKNVKYGKLGDFAKKFDHTSERRYLEQGYLRNDPYSTDLKQLEIIMQEPNITVLVKKKMFSSIAENHRPDYMDKDEKLYYKCLKILFKNKCDEVATLEKLSKIQRVVEATGKVDEMLLPIIMTLADKFSVGATTIEGNIQYSNQDASTQAFRKAIDKIRKVYNFSKPSKYTSWLTNDDLFKMSYGQGTGVMEFTNVKSLNTTTNVKSISAPGSASISFVDPYNRMIISEYDIEKAINDATNTTYNNKTFQLGLITQQELIDKARTKLNSIRRARGASSITIRVNPDTFLGQRVTAIIDSEGIELKFKYDSSFGVGAILQAAGVSSTVTVPDEYKINGEIAGFNGLDVASVPPSSNIKFAFKAASESELSLFQDLIAAIYNKLQMQANSMQAFKVNNEKTNYVRRKLMTFFLGRCIIQPMDVVHIYISSKTNYDNRILSGLKTNFAGLNMLQKTDSTLSNLKNAFDTVFNPSANLDMQAEKLAYVGPDFPDQIWSVIRGKFVNEEEGVHVFGGVVANASTSGGPLNNTVNINCSDNTAYFDKGKVNFKPATDVWNGVIFDPLTPFKSKFDSVTTNYNNQIPELLDENKMLLGEDFKDSLVKYKAGPTAGKPVTQNNLIQELKTDTNSNDTYKVYYAPDGLVYKWKEGIGVFSYQQDSILGNDPTRVGTPTIYKEPFAGMDTMNVISLLITGKPYNFATYYKATQTLEGFGNDSQTNQSSAHSYYNSLQKELSKNNMMWGNFIPFKNIVMDEQAYSKVLQAQFSVQRDISSLNDILRKIKDIDNKINTATGLSNTYKSIYEQNIDTSLQILNAEKQRLLSQAQIYQEEIRTSDLDNYGLKIVGDQVIFDIDQFLSEENSNKQDSNNNIARTIRRKTNYLTKRSSWAVRANEDKNLFIVDDSYDKDFDLAAYEKTLNGSMALYASDFTTVRDKIKLTANLLNLEVFCDTQGHIRVRPPQYNRMPSSVFYKMMRLKKMYGIQIFPKFLDDFFSNQLKSLSDKIGVTEDYIRLSGAVLNFQTDSDVENFLKYSGFTFLTNEDTGELVSSQDVINQANPDLAEDVTDNTFANLERQVNSNQTIFSAASRFDSVQELSNDTSLQDVSTILSSDRLNKLISRIEIKTGQSIKLDDYLIRQQFGSVQLQIPDNQKIDIINVTSKISEKIGERQLLLKSYYSAIKNVSELKSLDDENDNTANDLLSPGSSSKAVPEFFEHLIEDESYDDLGIGSGKRYIINNARVKDISIQENQPDYTMVQVNGKLDLSLTESGNAPGARSYPQNGSGLTSAIAIDYDMWRNYGITEPSAITLPFLTNPKTQCGPYASMLLSLARQNILRGNISLVGNEYQQPGEVVFLEERGLLFYVDSVNHSFTYGGSFNTSLQVSYGHAPGEYIPSILDLIGKAIYLNKDTGNLINHRQSNSINSTNVGVLMFNEHASSNSNFNNGDEGSAENIVVKNNQEVIKNILYQSAFIINENQSKGNNVEARLELRIYRGVADVPEDLRDFAIKAREILIGQSTIFTDPGSGKINLSLPSEYVPNPATDPDIYVDLTDNTEIRSPSQKAIDAARQILTSLSSISVSSSPDVDTTTPSQLAKEREKLRQILYNNIVDCWLSFKVIPPDQKAAGQK